MIIDIIIIKETGAQGDIHNHHLLEGVKIFFQAGNHEPRLHDNRCQDHTHVHRPDMMHLIEANLRLKDVLTELDLEVEARVRAEEIVR